MVDRTIATDRDHSVTGYDAGDDVRDYALVNGFITGWYTGFESFLRPRSDDDVRPESGRGPIAGDFDAVSGATFGTWNTMGYDGRTTLLRVFIGGVVVRIFDDPALRHCLGRKDRGGSLNYV